MYRREHVKCSSSTILRFDLFVLRNVVLLLFASKRRRSMSETFQWQRGFNQNLILSRLREARTVKDGRSSFDSSPYHFWLPVLVSAIASSGMTEAEKTSCVRSAVSDGAILLNDPATFLKRCELAFRKLKQRVKSKFLIYTTITYDGPKIIDWIADGDARIYWEPSSSSRLLRKIKFAQKDLEFYKRARKITDDEQGLTPVLVHVNAFDAIDAFNVANDSLDRFRGLLNLLINSGKSVNPFSGMSTPHAVNRLRRGPFNTVHRADGTLATETFWYEPRWSHEQETAKFSNAQDYRKQVLRWWKKLQKSPMNDFIATALLGYCRALDLHQADASLLGMWQVLEKLTGTDKYDLLIDRISRLFKDHSDAREIANHLRVRRNLTVHSTHDLSRDGSTILLHVEMLAAQAIFFYLNYGNRFEKLSDVLFFLDLPLDPKKLALQKDLICMYRKYQDRSL